MLKGLHIEGEWCEEPNKVKDEVKNFFSRRFSEKKWVRPSLDGVLFQQITREDNLMLVAKFDEEEVKEAVWDCASLKSPGPDGLNFKFIKAFWEVMKKEFLVFLEEFHTTGKFSRGTNPTFIALIPKGDDPRGLGDYRPISLVSCIYKIVSKVLARRLKKVLDKVIDQRQSAFLGGRQLLHSVMIANEVVEEAKRMKKKCIVFKVDYEKAYDSANWEFLFYMLRRLGFCDTWVKWIKGCMTSASVSVLVNGSPTSEFGMERGLGQGDPLAPFLFTVVAEGLSGLMRQATQNNMFASFKLGKNNVDINLLQYADDTIIFGEGNLHNIMVVKSMLRCFEMVSGLKVNFHKKQFWSIWC
uniref:LINE-1 reverse transcriptase isogeny n=1 Tax=Cajanus cajan TaxID=3821 RepID=A0A151S8Q9_CAJCA|nr:LINE-1 reverse transcriptase isogeny [Cajanus cajan]